MESSQASTFSKKKNKEVNKKSYFCNELSTYVEEKIYFYKRKLNQILCINAFK